MSMMDREAPPWSFDPTESDHPFHFPCNGLRYTNMRQKTDWGHISWIHSPNLNNPKQSFSVGITFVHPGKKLEKHIHYGFDQFLYILEGEGHYLINEERVPFRKGMFFYIEADSAHETFNTGTTPVREFIVSHPVIYSRDIDRSDPATVARAGLKIPVGLLYSAVEAIRTQLLESISLPFTIYDDFANIVIDNQKYPAYCREKCDPVNNLKCDCRTLKSYDTFLEGNYFICEFGLTVFHFPISYNGLELGFIRGGHILISDLSSVDYAGLYDSPHSTVAGIISLLRQITQSIVSYCDFNASRLLLEMKDQELRKVQSSNESLEKDLFVVKNKVTNLRINQHFLFNTLNSIASMALEGRKYDVYGSIIDLSKMFRYTMTMDLKLVSLKAELEYLDTYLNLQKLRYGEGLKISYAIPEELKEIKVPFNFLQPIVENAFTHGFAPSDVDKDIRISVRQQKNRIQITVTNNGVPLDAMTLRRVNRSVTTNTGHGLSLIYQKLKYAYGEGFKMTLKSEPDSNTQVIVTLPVTDPEA